MNSDLKTLLKRKRIQRYVFHSTTAITFSCARIRQDFEWQTQKNSFISPYTCIEREIKFQLFKKRHNSISHLPLMRFTLHKINHTNNTYCVSQSSHLSQTPFARPRKHWIHQVDMVEPTRENQPVRVLWGIGWDKNFIGLKWDVRQTTI